MKLRWATLGALGLGFAHIAGCQQILGFEDHTIVDGSAGSAVGSAGNPSGGSAGRATGGASSGSPGKGGSGASAGSGNSGGSGASAGSQASGGTGGVSMGSGGAAGDTGSGGTGGDTSSGGSGGDGNNGSGGTSGKGGSGGAGGDGSGGASAGTGNAGTGGTGGAGGGAGMSGSAGAGMAGSGTVADPPPIVGGVSGWASRYWDCCKPTCGWESYVIEGDPTRSCSATDAALTGFEDQSACSGGGPAHLCSSAAPWAVSPTLSYGFSAGPGAADCGECYQIEFKGTTSHGAATANQAMLAGKKMIVQVLNQADLPTGELDLLIPGGGVGALSACASQWGTSDLGAQYGGWLTDCSNDTACVRQKCENAFSDLPDFLAGCTWFLDWFHGANNPDLVYKRIACPAALTERSGLVDPP